VLICSKAFILSKEGLCLMSIETRRGRKKRHSKLSYCLTGGSGRRIEQESGNVSRFWRVFLILFPRREGKEKAQTMPSRASRDEEQEANG